MALHNSQHIVYAYHQNAFDNVDTLQVKFVVGYYDHEQEKGVTLGIGMDRDTAWLDAARNVSRAPLAASTRQGSDTWSLKSDEQYWKGKQP